MLNAKAIIVSVMLIASTAYAVSPIITAPQNSPIVNTSVCHHEYAGENSRVYNLDRESTETDIYMIEGIDGVENVFSQGMKYQIIVYKGQMFYWHDIHPKIMEILNAKEEGECR